MGSLQFLPKLDSHPVDRESLKEADEHVQKYVSHCKSTFKDMVGRVKLSVDNDGNDDVSIGHYRQEGQQDQEPGENWGGVKHVQLFVEERHDW